MKITFNDHTRSENRAEDQQRRHVCGCCDLKAWSRASAKLDCHDCNQPLIAR